MTNKTEKDQFANKVQPQKWTDVYPQGTKEGDEEHRLFVSLARHPKYVWRSVSALAKESNLSVQRVEEILNKYSKKGMVFQNPATEDQWGYWQRCPDQLPDSKKNLVKQDQQNRIEKSKS